MKNLKVVFASLLIAAMGIVGFSSFTPTNTKAFASHTFFLIGGVWVENTDNPATVCNTGSFPCAMVISDADLNEDEDYPSDATIEAYETNFAGTAHGTAISGTDIVVYKKSSGN